jgi:thioredoxin 2
MSLLMIPRQLGDTDAAITSRPPQGIDHTEITAAVHECGVYSRGMTIIVCPSCGARNRLGPIASGFPRCPRCKSELPWVVDADADSFTEETSASVPVVVDFWAAWCGPCRMISPVLEDLAGRHAGRLKIVKVDVDANPGLAARFGAQSIPLLVVIRSGREVDRIVGALPRAALEQRLGAVLAG